MIYRFHVHKQLWSRNDLPDIKKMPGQAKRNEGKGGARRPKPE